MRKIFLSVSMVFLCHWVMGQVGINTEDPSPASVLDVNSTSNNVDYGGFLPPRVNLAQRDAIPVSSADDGLMIYLIDGTERCVQIYDAVLNIWDNVFCMPVNDKPVANSVAYSGMLVEGQVLTASFSYSDTENDPEGSHIYTWYTATDAGGTNQTQIQTGGSDTLVLTGSHNGLFIAVEVTPVATSGLSPGNTIISNYDGPVTANSAPLAGNVAISGSFAEEQMLTADYDYSDNENDAEGTTTFQWYYASDASGAGATAISGATSNTYTLTNAEKDKYIAVEVTPVAVTGTSSGLPVMSVWGGPVNPPSTGALDLFISETVENGSYKVIEVANFTGTPINLDNYRIIGYQNGSNTPGYTYTFDSVTLADGEVYVIGHNTSVPNYDTTYSWQFNGNDVIVLTDASLNTVDIIGDIGVQADYNEDTSFRRNPGAGPNTTFDPNEWTEVGDGTDTSDLGNHTY